MQIKFLHTNINQYNNENLGLKNNKNLFLLPNINKDNNESRD